MFSLVIERVSKAILTCQRLRVLCTEQSFFNGDQFAKLCFSVSVPPLSPKHIGQATAAAQSIRILRTKSARAGIERTLQNGRGLTILPLIDQHISDGVLNFRPLTRVAFPVSQLGCFAKMRHGCRILDSLLRREPRQLERANHVGIVGRRRGPGLDCSL